MITARQLRVFYEVCRFMNMTKASKELYISQPAISKTIRDIEEEYGVKLFERLNKTLYLTAEGSMLYEYSKQVVNMMDIIDKTMSSCDAKDVIRVGASITVGTSILSEIVSGYGKEHSSVRLEAVVDNTPVIEELLLEGKLDVAIVEGRITSPEIESEIVGKTDIVLVVNRLHELYDREKVTLKDLEGRDFIVREKGSRTREIFSLEMERNNIRWKDTWSCHNTQTIKNAVDAGLGIGVLSKLSVRRRLLNGRLRSLQVFNDPLNLYIRIAYCANKYFSPNLHDFCEYIKTRVSVLAEELNS